ncbi:MAG: GNAT family N-acetyltransferase [Burkholderiales bacterium]|nr:MAG: GNAT family N-acetyltransferase [Burkholderiales bacterium]
MKRYTQDAKRFNWPAMLAVCLLAPHRPMYLRRLRLTDPLDQQLADSLFFAAPDFEMDAFGRLPVGDMALPLADRFPAGCAPEHRLTFAAFEHDQPVGLAQVGLHLPTADSAALLMLLVPRRWRQQHLGCEMVSRLSKQARRWPGIQRWYLNVTESNSAGQAFWRHCGFRTTATGLSTGHSHDLLAMERSVKARPHCERHGRPEDAATVGGRLIFARLP